MERKKEKLLRKIHMKDYTNSLEKILEDKQFSVDTKNLLLSMVYKIENSYKVAFGITKLALVAISSFV